MITLYQLEAKKKIQVISVERVEQSGIQDHGRKMSGKRAGMMENDVVRTAEETREDDDNGGGRDAG